MAPLQHAYKDVWLRLRDDTVACCLQEDWRGGDAPGAASAGMLPLTCTPRACGKGMVLMYHRGSARACFLQRNRRPEARKPAANDHHVRFLRSRILCGCGGCCCSSARGGEGQLSDGA